MNSSNPWLLDKLNKLDKYPDKKTAAINEEIKDTIAKIIANEQELKNFISSLKNTNWNPKTLELCCEELVERISEISTDAGSGYILAVLRANRRGKWLPGMVRALSWLTAVR